MSSVAILSSVTLNQFALDFEGNAQRILASIEIAKAEGSRLRAGPELEICGYSCQDHFYESDIHTHSWEVLAMLLVHPVCQGILVDVGMPVMHKGVNYNCRIVFLNGKILLIRPKLIMCDDGNYRESRWFTGWTKLRTIEDHFLPPIISAVTSQSSVPFGDALLRLSDTVIGFEICEELWNPLSSHIPQSLAGAEIILNGSGSHTEIRKASYALDLIKVASAKCGLAYVFSNLRGCDGERVYLAGSSAVVLNGSVLALGAQYGLKDVEVNTVAFNLDEISSYKNSIRSRSLLAARAEVYPEIEVDWALSDENLKFPPIAPTKPLDVVEFCCPEEEIARGPALWLWDYLRRSGGLFLPLLYFAQHFGPSASGFFLPLSGGVDSSSVAIIVYSMCRLIVAHLSEINANDPKDGVLQDVRRVLRKNSEYWPQDAKELCGQLLTTCYMGSENSSEETRARAKNLAEAIGSKHSEINISPVCSSFVEEASKALGAAPTFEGTRAENLALQNVQARSRMVYAYLFAQLSPWSRGQKGFLLVLGTANVDEAIRGYFTKYDCSAADLNPIGGISKTDLKSFIIYAGEKFDLPSVSEIVAAPPTAELQPLSSNQTDEQDMGMSYAELGIYGKLRKPGACGPVSMFSRLLGLWAGLHSPGEIASKVKHFWVSYAANRHKMSVLTPAVHMESYGPEDHRYDLRPILYPLDFSWQFRKIDEMLKKISEQ